MLVVGESRVKKNIDLFASRRGGGEVTQQRGILSAANVAFLRSLGFIVRDTDHDD